MFRSIITIASYDISDTGYMQKEKNDNVPVQQPMIIIEENNPYYIIYLNPR